MVVTSDVHGAWQIGLAAGKPKYVNKHNNHNNNLI